MDKHKHKHQIKQRYAKINFKAAHQKLIRLKKLQKMMKMDQMMIMNFEYRKIKKIIKG